MSRGLVIDVLLGSLLGSLAGCSRFPELPPGWTVEESRAFQQEHERSIGAPDGPLAVIDSVYLDPGQTLVIGAVGGRVVIGAAADTVMDAEVTLANDELGPRCRSGCDPASEVSLSEPRDLPLGRFTLRASPQSGTLRVLVLDPEAPARAAFDGLPWFPADARSIVPARFTVDAEHPSVELSTSRGLTKAFVRAGSLRAELSGETIELRAYRVGPVEGPLLVPLTDATTGSTTYPVGRYLEVAPPEGDVAVLDFNRLTNPWCAYSEHFNCPVPPADNRIDEAVNAGERVDQQGH